MKACYLNFKDLASLDEEEKAELMSLSLNNSAFFWGESVFTTGLFKNDVVTLENGHRKRLDFGLKWLTNDLVNEDLFETLIKVLKRDFSGQVVRFRFTLFKSMDGKVNHTLHISEFIQRDSLKLVSTQIPGGDLNRPKEVKVGFYGDSNYAQRKVGHKDLCFIGDRGEVVESNYSSMLFYSSDKGWVHPKTDNYRVESLGLSCGLSSLKFDEEIILLENINNFDGAFCINAVHGPVPIVMIDDIKFENSIELRKELLDKWTD